MRDAITWSEYEAYQILGTAGRIAWFNANSTINIHKEADKIIELAERIKAERATLTMLMVSR